tara:strand:+ start:3585 stop:4235 length:651 start_codon:yes stop_codon:yes gene_type:complete
VPITRQEVYLEKFNPAPVLPYNLRIADFQLAMQDIYDFFHDMNTNLREKNLRRFEDMARAAMLSGMLSDLMTDALATHSRSLVVNGYHNGHPDLLVAGKYAHDKVQAGEFGVEIKSTNKSGGAVDTHGARSQWMCVFVYRVDKTTEPADDRAPLRFTEVYLAQVDADDFRSNRRLTETGTRTATLDADGVAKLRRGWIYLDKPEPKPRASRSGKQA